MQILTTYWQFTRSQTRIMIYCWALFSSIFIASQASPPLIPTVIALIAGYLMSLSLYVFNDLTDITTDKLSEPNKPLASGRASTKEARIVIISSASLSLLLSLSVNFLTFVFFLIALSLGLIYSAPKTRAKNRFPMKTLVTCAGAAISSLTGGAVVGSITLTVLLASLIFSVFMLVLASAGDLADIKADLASGAKSLPIVLGASRTVYLMSAVPFIICGLVFALQRQLGFNPITPWIILILSAFALISLNKLRQHAGDTGTCRGIRMKLRMIHVFIQLTLMMGSLDLV